MEHEPMTPRPRSRRADRSAMPPVQEPVAPMQTVQPMAPVQQMQPMQPVQPVQPVPPVQPGLPYQQGGYPQTQAPQHYAPAQPYPQQRMQAQGYPQGMHQRPVQGQYPQQMSPAQGMGYPQRPVHPVRPVQPMQPVQQAPAYAPRTAQPVQARPQQAQPMYQSARPEPRPMPRSKTPAARPEKVSATPRALQQQQEQRARSSIWKTPDPTQDDAVQRRKSLFKDNAPLDKAEKPGKKARKLPAWLVTALAVMLIAVMGLLAMQNLYRAYLATAEKERIAAYEKVLSNYHVTEDAAGQRRITWQDQIERYASEYNLQPAFVAAIIRNESSFRTNAESGVGARGLMQLMPDTAEWIAGKLNDRNYSFDSMWDAETNIRYGCWYLGYLSELFQGDPVLVCSAYHAGQGDVRSWLSDRSISADGRTVPVDKVPIAETRQYAGRVTQAYGIYQTLLYTDDPQLPMYAPDGGSAVGSAR